MGNLLAKGRIWLSLFALVIGLAKLSFCSAYAIENNSNSNEPITKIQALYSKQTEISISDQHINRINITPYRVKNIIGDQTRFKAIVSKAQDNIFLTSNELAGEVIDLAIICSSGEVIDLKVKVTERAAPTIINLIYPGPNAEGKDNMRSISKAMLQAMQNNLKGKFYVQKLDQEIKLPGVTGVKIKEGKSYRFAGLRGYVLELENKQKSPVKIDLEKLKSNFKHLRYFVGSDIVPARTTNKIYLIINRGTSA